MKKRKLAILLLLVACIGLTTAFMTISKNNDMAKPTEGKQPPFMELVNLENIATFTVQNANGVFDFRKKDGLLWLVNDESSLDNKAEEIASILAKMEVKRKVTKPNLAAFGLQDAKTEVRITTKEGKEIALFVGNETPTKEGYYVKKAEDDAVYIVSSAVAKMVHFSMDTSSMERTIFPVSLVNIKKIEYVSKSQQFTLQRYTDKRDQNFSDYYLDYPFKTKPQVDIAHPDLPAFLDFVNAAVPISETSTSADFGFQDPNLDVLIQTIDGHEKRVIVGNTIAEDSNRYYVRFNSSEKVYELQIEQPDKIFQFNPVKLAIQAPVYAFITKVKKLELERDGKKYSINMENPEAYLINGKKVETQVVKDLFLSLLELKADTDMGEQASGAVGQNQLSVSVTYTDGDVTTTNYQDYDEQFYSITQSGDTDFVIAKDKFKRVFELLGKVDQSIK
ncbi:hypothetical protein BABA_21266 [Neobacillus bataviensis LMG 21833]|uniref:DUF4340 domain-containing protein n=1 Tax=Neobacillus bataviensis LMG 21833 TaxID=1117379 RepID=K6DWI3_9BACI|nr:DUF4340 domain-containing protein [Neobacillus bataviensis]EKN65216.1 hypothetical protein BABA_21266 [Neobacillus bataviensis LMG 21833]